MWLISNSCQGLIDAIPQAIYDEDGKNDEDIKKTDGVSDDILDCARYGLKSMLGAKDKPLQVKLEEVLIPIQDNTQKHLAHLQFIEKTKKHSQAFRLRR